MISMNLGKNIGDKRHPAELYPLRLCHEMQLKKLLEADWCKCSEQEKQEMMTETMQVYDSSPAGCQYTYAYYHIQELLFNRSHLKVKGQAQSINGNSNVDGTAAELAAEIEANT